MPSDSNHTLLARIRIIQEATWLTAIVAVPLIVSSTDWMIQYIQLPKVTLLRLLGSSLLVLIMLEWALSTEGFSLVRRPSVSDFKIWLRSNPSSVLFVSVVLFVGAVFLSFVFSVGHRISLLGATENVDSYGMYNMMAYFVLFFAISTRVKSATQVWRILYAVVAVGSISSFLSIIEYLEITSFGTASGVSSRVSSTFGNPIFFAAFLVMSIPISLAMAVRAIHRGFAPTQWATWWAILSLQFIGVVLSLSRGPWVAIIGSVILLTVATLVFMGRRHAQILLAVILSGLAIALLVSKMLPEPGKVPNKVAVYSLESPEERFLSIGSEVSGGLSHRILIWKSASELILQRPWFDDQNGATTAVRHLFGYGPDTFGYAYPLRSEPIVGVQHHAHNYLIHLAVEVGLLGALTFVFVLGASLFVATSILFKKSMSDHPERKLIAIALFAIVVGKAVEQLVGIPRIGDFTVFWSILGLIAALPTVANLSATKRQSLSQTRPSLNVVRMGTTATVALVLIGVF